jgi:hypothetical protein
MSSLLLLLSVLAADPEAPRHPVAMVLEVEGRATLRRGEAPARPLREADLLRPGDRVEAAEGARLSVVLLADGHGETVQPGRTVTVGPDGCAPADAVRRHEARLPQADLTALRGLARSSRGGVGVLRHGPEGEEVPAVTPLRGSRLLTNRPAFSWPAVPGATSYEVRLFALQADRKPEWKATTTQTHLAYPEKQPPLPYNRTRYWEVTPLDKDGQPLPAIRSRFHVAPVAQIAQLAKLKLLARGSDPKDWLLAAASYEAVYAYDDALPLYEKLAARRPDQAAYQRALAHYYTLAGRREDAARARSRARELGLPVER